MDARGFVAISAAPRCSPVLSRGVPSSFRGVPCVSKPVNPSGVTPVSFVPAVPPQCRPIPRGRKSCARGLVGTAGRRPVLHLRERRGGRRPSPEWLRSLPNEGSADRCGGATGLQAVVSFAKYCAMTPQRHVLHRHAWAYLICDRPLACVRSSCFAGDGLVIVGGRTFWSRQPGRVWK